MLAHLVGPPIMKSAGHCSAKFSGLFGGPKLAVDSTGPATKAHKMVKKNVLPTWDHQLRHSKWPSDQKCARVSGPFGVPIWWAIW